MRADEVMVFGTFNIVHPGHIRLFRFAKDLGDRLVVGVFSDVLAGNSGHVTEQNRLEGVRANGYVDECFLVDTTIRQVLEERRPGIVVKGKEFEGTTNLEERIIESWGGRLVFSSGESFLSSSDLIRRELAESSIARPSVPEEYLRRHGITREELVKVVQRFDEARIVVAGDMIVDDYITCDAIGMSREEPTLVVTPVETSRFLGGAGIVAGHAASLGAEVHLLSVIGEDAEGEYCRTELERLGVMVRLVVDETRPTTLKQRFRSDGRGLLRVSRLSQQTLAKELQDEFVHQFKMIGGQTGSFVFSDFNYGCLPTPLVDRLMTMLRAAGTVIAADSQSSSQVGDISRFAGATLITPTEHEARVALRNQSDGLVVVAHALGSIVGAEHVLLTLSAEGTLVNSSSGGGEWTTDRLPALNDSPKDVSGAGDCLLVTATLALNVGATIWEAACLGAIAAALQVGKVGNVPLRRGELLEILS
jgi:rfaE bifunctional protein kinase chain/domain